MSRFYDVLKRAEQSRPLDPEESEPISIPSPEEHPMAVQEILAEPEEGTPAASDAPWAEGPSAVVSEGEFAAFPPSRGNGDFGSSLRVTFHRRARLIPNIQDSAVIEQYRLLRTKLLQERQEKMFKSLLITSPGPREGKTVTTLNLALTFGLLPSFKVLVVEGDLRRGSLGDLLRLGPRSGLSELIEGSAQLEETILKPEGLPVSFIVCGNACHSPGELLHSARLPELLQKVTEAFDLVLLDSPPVNLVTDAHLLASYCDATLLVSRAFVTSSTAMEEASRALLPYRVIGTILNGSTKRSFNSGYRSYY